MCTTAVDAWSTRLTRAMNCGYPRRRMHSDHNEWGGEMINIKENHKTAILIDFIAIKSDILVLKKSKFHCKNRNSVRKIGIPREK